MKTYTVTQIANIATNNSALEIQKARDLAYRLGDLRKECWNKFGGIQAWGIKTNEALKTFKLTNPPEKYHTIIFIINGVQT